jgi:hypothetical protein
VCFLATGKGGILGEDGNYYQPSFFNRPDLAHLPDEIHDPGFERPQRRWSCVGLFEMFLNIDAGE